MIQELETLDQTLDMLDEINNRSFVSKNFKEINSQIEKILLKLKSNEETIKKNKFSEDYIKIADNCSFIFLEYLLNFDERNSNLQQRFITFIDIIYEKKIPLMITSQEKLDLLNSSNSLKQPFKRTVSRLYELTSISYKV